MPRNNFSTLLLRHNLLTHFMFVCAYIYFTAFIYFSTDFLEITSVTDSGWCQFPCPASPCARGSTGDGKMETVLATQISLGSHSFHSPESLRQSNLWGVSSFHISQREGSAPSSCSPSSVTAPEWIASPFRSYLLQRHWSARLTLAVLHSSFKFFRYLVAWMS